MPEVLQLHSLNTRTIVRGRGTDQEDPSTGPATFYMYGQSTNSRMQGNDLPRSPEETRVKVCSYASFMHEHQNKILPDRRSSGNFRFVRSGEYFATQLTELLLISAPNSHTMHQSGNKGLQTLY